MKTIKGTSGRDILSGRNPAEFILGLAGNDDLYGNGGADRLLGGVGKDLLDGGLGADLMKGGDGNDSYRIDNIGDKIGEKVSEGNDTVLSAISYRLTANVEMLKLTGGKDIDAAGNTLDNRIVGNRGDNILDGKSGGDSMSGGKGDDTYYFDDAGDKATETAEGGTDTVKATVDAVLAANLENLKLKGTADIDGTGNSGQNVLTGNKGDNRLDGGAGIDWMLGGLGDDTYIVDNSADKITELGGAGTDRAIASVSCVLSENVENLTLSGSASINGTGNALANLITGNSAANRLYADDAVNDGIGGGDQLHGGGGNDTLYSGDGSLELDGGDGTADIADYSLFTTAVTVTFASFVSSVAKAAGGADSLVDIEGARGGSAGDTFEISSNGDFYGGAGDDVLSDGVDGDGIFARLFGDGGNDTLSAGVDGGRLNGGADDDTLIAASTATAKIFMTGGSGADSFGLGANINGSGGVLADGTLAASVEIKDFVDGQDHLVFEAFGSVDTAQEWYDLLWSENTIEDETDGLHIGADGGAGSALVMGLSVVTFSADDILVV